jgi:hypothetical protein
VKLVEVREREVTRLELVGNRLKTLARGDNLGAMIVRKSFDKCEVIVEELQTRVGGKGERHIEGRRK